MITWNTDCNAPGCPGEIVSDDGRTLLIQTDWDYPGTAGSFGWSIQCVRRCPHCEHVDTLPAGDQLISTDAKMTCAKCGEEYSLCEHNGDGTVPCKACGLSQSDFIAAAYDWLCANDGATADDPGYFNN